MFILEFVYLLLILRYLHIHLGISQEKIGHKSLENNSHLYNYIGIKTVESLIFTKSYTI